MKKNLYYSLDDGEGEGGVMSLSGCMEWIKGDMEANYQDKVGDPVPTYTITPVYMTAKEYKNLPDQ